MTYRLPSSISDRTVHCCRVNSEFPLRENLDKPTLLIKLLFEIIE